MNKYILIALVIITAISCRKREFDEPPIKEIPEGKILTIQELRDMFQGSPVRFEDDYSVFATITMDDRSGNIFRNAYVQDETNAIVLRTNFPGGLYAGDSIRIALKGTTLSSFNGLLQVDSVDVDKNIVKQATNRHFEPELVTLDQVINGDYQSKLVRIQNVEFATDEIGKTYANAENQQAQNRTLIDCADEFSMIVRTSGYANFAGEVIPEGNGDITFIVGEFNSTKQLYIRNLDEVNLDNERCSEGPIEAVLSKDFSDQSITSGGWQNYVVKSTPTAHQWRTSDQGSAGNYYAVARGWDGSIASETELWMISPAIDFSDVKAPGLTFRSSTNFNGPAVQLMISKNYDGVSNPAEQGTWVNYTGYASWSSGNYDWTPSGVIPLTEFDKEEKVFVAFKYTSNTNAATWQIDDIIIREY